MGRSLGVVVIAAILLGSLAVASLLVSMRPEPARREPPSRIPFAVTEPVVAGAGAIPVLGAGTVRPAAEVDVAAAVGGRVNPAFESGGRIDRGQSIFRIDDADYRNRVTQVRADVVVQQTEVLRVEEEARIARAEYERFQRRREGPTSAVDAGPLTFQQPQLEAARAVLDKRRTAVEEAELALSRTDVRAPFDGVVRDESLDVGQFVAAGQSVGRLYASDAVDVAVPLSDADAALIPGLWNLEAGSPDRSVAVRVIAEVGERSYVWPGYVDRAETALDTQTRTIEVIVRVPNPFTGGRPADGVGSPPEAGGGADPEPSGGPPLLLGQFVDVHIQGLTPAEFFRVRRPALRPGDELWVVRGDRVAIVPVQVLHRADDEVFVTGPLEDGWAVVVGSLEVATEGMVVRTEAGGGS